MTLVPMSAPRARRHKILQVILHLPHWARLADILPAHVVRQEVTSGFRENHLGRATSALRCAKWRHLSKSFPVTCFIHVAMEPRGSLFKENRPPGPRKVWFHIRLEGMRCTQEMNGRDQPQKTARPLDTTSNPTFLLLLGCARRF